jgi:glycosyltransferase involved in cell wall biosynthesis/predicted SAM-dependent methyltransferase
VGARLAAPPPVSPARASSGADRCLRIARDHLRWSGFEAVDGSGEALAAIEHRLPFGDGSVGAIYLDRVLELLDLPQGAILLRECRRVLARGGRLRVVTADLARVLEQHGSSEAWKDGGWFGNGYDWALMRVRVLNRAFREGGRRWLYDEAELARVATLVGLRDPQRCRAGESADPRLAGRENASEVDLIVELAKPVRAEGPHPLVSVLVPLYRTTYLRQTVASVLDQTYDNFELVLCDDGPPGGAEAVLQTFAAHPRFDRIRYFPNAERQGDARNYVACFKKARGAYIKFLNDDDTLAPRCLEVMASCLQAHPEVTLVTSHRQIIDEQDRLQPEAVYTRRPIGRSAIVGARSALARMLGYRLNFIGEPSTAMFRKSELETFTPNFWSVAGTNFHGNGDVSVWMNLLAQGELLYLTESLSQFRIHPTQTSHDPEVIRLAKIAWDRAADGAAELGLYEPGASPGLDARPLDAIPWWPPALIARLERVRACLDQRRADAALSELDGLAAEVGAVTADPELAIRIAELRAEAGDPRGALKVAIAATRATPHHQPAHLMVARLLSALGDVASAQTIFRDTQTIFPLLRPEQGLVTGPDGRLFLEPVARFRVEPDVPDARLTLRLGASAIEGFHNLPLRLTVQVGAPDGAGAVETGEIVRVGEELAFSLDIPHRRGATEILVHWRGSGERGALPTVAAPLAIQIIACELALSPVGAAPASAVRANG